MLSINPKLLYVRNQKTGKFVPLVAIIGPKGPPGTIDNITDYLTNETGDSEELAISQKGVTLLLKDVEDEFKTTNTELTKSNAEFKKLLKYLNIPYLDGTKGLEFKLEDNTYSITSAGSAPNEGNIIIPSKIFDIPVTSIGDAAFEDYTLITSVTIPDSVTWIGGSAFKGCTGLTSVTIGNSVTSIGDDAFSNTGYYNNESNWENGVLYIGKYLIEAKDTISGAYTIKSGTKVIADSAFSGCTRLTSVTIPDSVTSIGFSAFRGCTGLTSISMSNSIKYIRASAFQDCIRLTDVYYYGTESDWKSIDIRMGNQSLTNATIHYLPKE